MTDNDWNDDGSLGEGWEPISSNGFSVDLQAYDALYWLEAVYPHHYTKVSEQFPEPVVWNDWGTHIDTETMGVSEDYVSWLVDAIEDTGVVTWWEGEPWGRVDR